MYYFAEIACVVAELWMIQFLLSGMFWRRKLAPWVPTIEYIIVGGIMVVLAFGDNMTFVRIGFSFLAFVFIGLTNFHTNILQSALSAMVMCVVAALSDVCFSVALTKLGVASQALMALGGARSLYVIASHLLMFGIVSVIYAISPKPGVSVPLKILFPLLPCWTVSALLCVLLAWQILVKGQEVPPLSLVVLVGMLYTNIVFVYYTKRISEQEVEKWEQAIAEHHYAMQQEYYAQFRIQQEETRALWHDISKFLRAVKVEGSGETLQQVEQMLDSVAPVVDVNNHVVSVILNEYVQAAKASQVQMELDVQIPRELFVTAVDLYVILGNTLDNALEACEDLPVEQRRISLWMKMHNDVLFYGIENPYTADRERIIQKKIHGYGLQNVRCCVQKYQGTMEIEKENGVYRFSAHLNGK